MIKVGRAGLLVLGLAVNAFGATVASAQVRSPSQLPVGVDLPDADPSELVAARIRAALASPDSPESWADLAEVLPGLGEDTGPSAAVLVADSIGRAAARSGAGGSPKMIDKARTAWLATIRRARDAARCWHQRHGHRPTRGSAHRRSDGLLADHLGMDHAPPGTHPRPTRSMEHVSDRWRSTRQRREHRVRPRDRGRPALGDFTADRDGPGRLALRARPDGPTRPAAHPRGHRSGSRRVGHRRGGRGAPPARA